MMDKEESTSSPYLLTSTPERTHYAHPERGQMGYAFTPPNSMSSPIYTPTVFNNNHDEQLNTHRMRKLGLPAEPIAISENAQAPDCSKSLWLDSSSEVLNERNTIHKHSKPTQLPAFGSGNIETMLQKSGVSPIPPLTHTHDLDIRKPLLSLSQSRQQYGYKIQDHGATNQLGFQPIGWGTEREDLKTKPETQQQSYSTSKRSYINPKFQDTPSAVDGIYDIQGAAMDSMRRKMCSHISSPVKSTEGSFVPLHPRPKTIECTWVDTRPQYSKKNCTSATVDSIGCHARGWPPTCKDQPSYAHPEVFPGRETLGASKCSATQELLTASMCMPQSGQQGYEKSAFCVFSHTSSINHGGSSKRSGVHELKWKDENLVPVAKPPPREVKPNSKPSPGPSLQSTPARKVLSLVSTLNNESTDSGFDSLHHSTDNFSKSHDEFSSSEDYSLDIYSHKENSIPTNIPKVQPEEIGGIEKESSTEIIPKLQRKLDIPQRSASPVDPEFRGVMLQMRTKMEQNDKVQLSIRAFFNCRKSPRLLRKTIETEQRPRTRRDSTSSSDSDYAAELFPKKRRNQAGKQCASCRTKTTPLWRDAEDGTPLCNACGIRYKKYRIRCLSCWHIPRKETKTNLQCTNCGETLKLSLFKSKQWKC